MSALDSMKITKRTAQFSRLLGTFEHDGEWYLCYMSDYGMPAWKQNFDVSHYVYDEEQDHEILVPCWHEEAEGANCETLFRALVEKFYKDVLKGE